MQLDDNRLANRIDGWIRDLGKALPEKCVNRPWCTSQGSYGSIVAHGPNCVLTVAGHGRQHHPHIFPSVAKDLLQLNQVFDRGCEGRRLQRSICHQRTVSSEAVELLQ
jgi:hypothetical protein